MTDVFRPHYGEVLDRIATALEGKAPDAARDYVVFFDADWNEPDGARRFAVLVHAYTDEEAVKQVRYRGGMWQQPANYLPVPYDPKNSLHAALVRNERTPIAPDAAGSR